jgi:hypothetical protein
LVVSVLPKLFLQDFGDITAVSDGCGPSMSTVARLRNVTFKFRKQGAQSIVPRKPTTLLSVSVISSEPIGKLFTCIGFLDNFRNIGVSLPGSSLTSKCEREMQESDSFLGTTRSKKSA